MNMAAWPATRASQHPVYRRAQSTAAGLRVAEIRNRAGETLKIPDDERQGNYQGDDGNRQPANSVARQRRFLCRLQAKIR